MRLFTGYLLCIIKETILSALYDADTGGIINVSGHICTDGNGNSIGWSSAADYDMKVVVKDSAGNTAAKIFTVNVVEEQ